MTDAAPLLLLHKVIHDAPPRIVVHADGVFIDVVQQIKIKVLHLALFQLLLKNIRRIVALRHHVAGKLCGQIKAFSGMLFQAGAHHRLRMILHIRPCGIEVIHSMVHGVVHHGLRQCGIDLSVLQHRQTHGAKAQHRQLYSLKVPVDHLISLPITYLAYTHCNTSSPIWQTVI